MNDFKCPKCKSPISFDTIQSGKIVCPHCKQRLRISQPESKTAKQEIVPVQQVSQPVEILEALPVSLPTPARYLSRLPAWFAACATPAIP